MVGRQSLPLHDNTNIRTQAVQFAIPELLQRDTPSGDRTRSLLLNYGIYDQYDCLIPTYRERLRRTSDDCMTWSGFGSITPALGEPYRLNLVL
jgi:hypothetical protein